MNIEELDYHLPPELIATQPAQPRDSSRLLVYRRAADTIEHLHFRDLPQLLDPTDLLVVNDTRVLPAKLLLRKATGASIPGLFLHEQAPGRWEVMLRSRGKLAPGMVLTTEPASEFHFHLQARGAEPGHWIVSVARASRPCSVDVNTCDTPLPPSSASQILERIGHVPLPPYIEKARHDGGGAQDESADREHYQTIYAQLAQPGAGSVAAPTAGLHFTPELLDRLNRRGVQVARVTLQVGLGTFLPVQTATLEEHPMHTEEYAVPAATIAALCAQRSAGQRIVVVGTTAARTLEAAASQILNVDPSQPPAALRSTTNLLISPGYRFQLTDTLITNFHLPRSTLLALVGALTGLDRLKEIYAEAIRQGYRFYSYGDAMLIM